MSRPIVSWLRAQVADEQDAARRRREHPACRCGSRRPHLAGPACGDHPPNTPPWWWDDEQPQGGPAPPEGGAPTAH